MYNVQDYSVLFYNNAVPPVICEGWHIALAYDSIISLRAEVWVSQSFIEMPYRGTEVSCHVFV